VPTIVEKSSTLRLRRPAAALLVLLTSLCWVAAVDARPAAEAGRQGVAVDYFALGDSVASGHGLGDRGACRRSSRAYPRKVRAALEDRRGLVRFRMLACSGAVATGAKEDGPRSLRYQVTRTLDELSSRRTLVTLTIGVNDFEWSDIVLTYFRLRSDESSFEEWRSAITNDVAASLRRELRRLLAHRNVAVVLTEYYNPVNTGSILFGPPLPCESFAACYERTERIAHGLNAALREVRASLPGRARVRVARVHDAFHGHESPAPICGTAGPDAAETWIQHPQDPGSDSFPAVPPEIEAVTGDWRGDCFHPNEEGSRAIAAAVDRAALAVGR
jgi:lysophospholipase L1-like esterase